MEDPTLQYVNRIRNAIVLSLILHLVMMGAWSVLPHKEKLGLTQSTDPIVLQLQPPQEPEQPKSLVDIATPSEVAPENDTNIAEQNAVATDTALHQGEEAGPRFEKEDDMDILPERPLIPQPPSPPRPAIPPQPEPAPAEEAPQDTAEPEPVQSKPEAVPTKAQKNPTPSESKPKDTTPQQQERIQVAREQSIPSPPVPPTPQNDELPNDGRVKDKDRGVEQVGLAGYEAIQDELAPYLRQMKDKVDLYWKQKMLLNYTGSKPVKVEIDCEIDHNGHIVSVKVVGNPDDKIYAALCKQAMVMAAPFGPFPFKVPDIYRNKNLEIRWAFNFL